MTIQWQSVAWADGSKYEGLVQDDACHVRGVFNYSDGDKYLGEYEDNQMEGYGVYIWNNGTIYRGQWQQSMMNGCGTKISKQPNGQFLAEEGYFVDDEWAGNELGCSVVEARRAAAQADTAAQMAAVFQLSVPPPSPPPPASSQSIFSSSTARKKDIKDVVKLHGPDRTHFMDAPKRFAQELLQKVPSLDKINFEKFDKINFEKFDKLKKDILERLPSLPSIGKKGVESV